MSLKGAFLAIAASGAFLLLAACGGGVDSGSSQSQAGSAGDSGQLQAGSGGSDSAAGPNAAADPSSNDGSGSSRSQPGGATDPTAQYIAIDLGVGSANGIGDGVQVGGASKGAALWRSSASSIVELSGGTVALATSGGTQVGWLGHDDQWVHALKWTGSTSSAVDLHPSGFRESMALGISGDQIVGVGLGQTSDGEDHALVWTSHGVVDINPSGFRGSAATATDGAQHAGYGIRIGSNNQHALLWVGSGRTAVDLHPVSGYLISFAYGVNGGQQVGWGGDFRAGHALLWTGNAQSVVDLHPAGFLETNATAVAAGRQVGQGTTADGSIHALLWNGTAGSVIDLHVFLPAGFRNSQANGIDPSGNIVGTADGHAILWRRQ